ncbi:hypothetical protein PVAG01_00994 [Phlyctema vagabunda]|uniref:Aminoglycoside phosphotransferase domain-containing protein n=1 Tax=Phlyctema vagabunda TaxID=108571 RepID=A0ABR4PVV2_9HELO
MTTTPLNIQYFRNFEALPAPLPTTSEILASDEIIKGTEPWATRKVVGVGRHYVAKYSRSNEQIEGENLLFLERNNLRFAPLLYAMWKEDDGTVFLIMERLPGQTLESLWPTLQDPEKDLDKSYLPHYLFYWPKYPTHVSGPYTTERALVQGLISKSRLNAQNNKRHSYLADFYESQLVRDLVVEGRMPVFTHSDLQRKNILVEEVEGESAQDEKQFHVSLVDWESAGWYPVYWEYFAAFLGLKWNDDWCSKVGDVVDIWPAEAAMMKLIHQDLWL